jgi:hypothetical protein
MSGGGWNPITALFAAIFQIILVALVIVALGAVASFAVQLFALGWEMARP